MDKVKEEKFGSRPSILQPIFEKNKIRFEKNIYFITCRKKYNSKVNTRYLIFLEALSKAEFNEKDFTYIKNSINDIFLHRSYILFLDEKQKKIYLKNFYGEERELSFLDFKRFILTKTVCPYVCSSAKGSEESSPFSKFFRENLGAGFSMTDIDFLLPNSIFIEEKTFSKESGDNVYGYIGYGQCLSFNELLEDVFKEHCKILIIFTKEEKEYFYLYPFRKMDCKNAVKEIERWDNMVELNLNKSYRFSKESFVRFITDIANNGCKQWVSSIT
ncbi:hypothetical protein [Thermosediminibacter oceani]|uniref:Uncharacterized protein n=1 Tax=Thermosediminibacter oceani (strain ATCC BAA-1034 / DSM 16646 / JW/IW-1228P) TaxID=555079 RepID=D9RY92_THEOJ|nr:hypothetical protein [Thermosediminibacter oceani]ADL08316.1 hypothetical protein Toce_1574 [Thermosediminibacter oceani DSM 16646]